MLRALRIAFHVGLLPCVVILVRGEVAGLRLLLPLGVAHILLLWIVGRRLLPPLDTCAIDTLHRAGFLHTLIGLGAAVMAVAAGWDRAGASATPPVEALAPIGSALAPHILAVWLAHSLRLRTVGHDTSEEAVVGKLNETLDAVLRALARVQDAALRFSSGVDEATRASGGAVRTVSDSLGLLATITRDSTEAAAGFRRSVADVAKATEQINLVHGQIVDLLHSELVRREREVMRP